MTHEKQVTYRDKPIVGITLGDPYGIGPEIVVKSLLHPEVRERCHALVIGHPEVVEKVVPLMDRPLRPDVWKRDQLGEITWSQEASLPIVAPERAFEGDVHRFGIVSPQGGAASFAYIQTAVELAMAGSIDAIVTAPIHKEAINQAGYRYSGHTEIFADLTGSPSVVMMLVCGSMRVAHVTTHIGLKDVPDRISQERIVQVVRLFADALRGLGVSDPHIGVAALNPHGGEGGLFGDEEMRTIIPAIEQCQAEGFRVTGPVPGDTVFVMHRAGRFDGVVAMYHDQGHIPVKLMGFEVDPQTGATIAVRGVNVTLGLPVIRTSVDHGTAFDIAGKGIANEASMIDALLLASSMAAARAGKSMASGKS